MIISRSSSSFFICMERVGCVIKHDSAALPKCRYVSTATIYSNCVNVIIKQDLMAKIGIICICEKKAIIYVYVI
jgi:hypothetical protein